MVWGAQVVFPPPHVPLSPAPWGRRNDRWLGKTVTIKKGPQMGQTGVVELKVSQGPEAQGGTEGRAAGPQRGRAWGHTA